MTHFETVQKVRRDATADIANYIKKVGPTTVKNLRGIHGVSVTVKHETVYFGPYAAEDVNLETVILVADMFNQMPDNEKNDKPEN